MKDPEPAKRVPACSRCRFYFVTWDREAPHGCRAFGFKSRKRPSWEVYRTSGAHCKLFEPPKRGRRRS